MQLSRILYDPKRPECSKDNREYQEEPVWITPRKTLPNSNDQPSGSSSQYKNQEYMKPSARDDNHLNLFVLHFEITNSE